MSTETHRVLIGACGWKHKAWMQSFYDENLPMDWQLGFYANEFSVVYVPAADWLDDLELDAWSDDVSESFRFILEVPASLLSDKSAFLAAMDQAESLNEFCLSFVFQLEQTVCDDIHLFQSCYEAANAIATVCVDTQDLVISNGFEQVLFNNNISQLWNGKNKENLAPIGSLMMSKVSCDGLDMRGLRTILEAGLSASSEECVSVLILDGEPPSLEILRNADTLLNLL